MTTINIGTSKKNITNVKIDKPFKEITFQDINKIVKETYPDMEVNIFGWCDVTNKNKSK